jgi:hypothetical protein
MRIINNIIFFLALLGGIAFAVVNWTANRNFFWAYTEVPFYYFSLRLPVNLIVFLVYMGIIFVQWLVAQGAWAVRDRKLERAEKETLRLKARLYDLTEGSLVDDIKDAIKETRKELREDIKWLAGQSYRNTPVQVIDGQPERELPPLLEEG